MRRVEPRLHFVDAAGQIGEVAVQSVELIEQRQQPQQDEAVGEQVAAQHVARPHEEDVGAGDDHHRARDGQRLGDGKEQRQRLGAALFGVGLGLVERVELLDLAFLRVGGAHDAHARERLAEHARHAVIEIGQLDADGLQPAVDERQRAAERDRQHDDERRERPREEEERGDVEERDARPLDERQHRVDGDRRPVGLDEKDVGEIAAGQAIEEIEIGAVEPPEEIVAEPARRCAA